MSQKKLTERQKKFCDYYIISLNATDAAIKAGYSKKTARKIGHENLTKLDIKSYIEKRLKTKENKRIATQDEVLETITKVLRDDECKKSDILKACELMGKRYAIFKDVVDQNIKVDKTLEDYFK